MKIMNLSLCFPEDITVFMCLRNDVQGNHLDDDKDGNKM